MRPGSFVLSRRPARGYTFVALLAVMAVLSVGLAVAAPTWAARQQRAREQELLRIGAIYAQALKDYRDSAPGTLKTGPASLDDLLLDKRFVGVRRHLRRLYPDPLDPSRPWGLLRDADGGIVAVYSQSQDAPRASGRIDLGDFVLPPAQRYADWKFPPAKP